MLTFPTWLWRLMSPLPPERPRARLSLSQAHCHAKDGHWVISQIHGSVRAGDLRNLCSSYLLDFRSDMMRFSARVVERSADSSAHSIVCGRRSDSGASPDSHWPLHSAPSTQPDPTELVRSASLSLPEVRGLRTHSCWKNCQRRWSRLKPVLYFFERTMTKIQ